MSTVNYEGRRYGIHSGQPIFQAKKRAPPADSIFLPVDHGYYEKMSDSIDQVIRRKFESAERASIDEWFLEADNEPERAARALKDEIAKETGFTCSVGVAPSRLGSKMAADRSKPNGLLVLDSQSERMLIRQSDVQKIFGIGKKTAEALQKMGVEKVSDLEKIDKVEMVEKFGKKTGAWFIALSEGRYEDLLSYKEAEQSEVSRIGTLRAKTRDISTLALKLSELEKDAKDWLRSNNRFFRTLAITFVTEDMKIHTKSLSFRNPKSWNENLHDEEVMLIKQFLDENPLGIRRIGVKFVNLVDVTGQMKLINGFPGLLEFQ